MFFLFQKTVKYKIYCFILRSTATYVFSPVAQWKLLMLEAQNYFACTYFVKPVCILTLFHSMIKTKLQWSEKMGADGHVQCHSSKEQRIINDNRTYCQKYVFEKQFLIYHFCLSCNHNHRFCRTRISYINFL